MTSGTTGTFARLLQETPVYELYIAALSPGGGFDTAMGGGDDTTTGGGDDKRTGIKKELTHNTTCVHAFKSFMKEHECICHAMPC